MHIPPTNCPCFVHVYQPITYTRCHWGHMVCMTTWLQSVCRSVRESCGVFCWTPTKSVFCSKHPHCLSCCLLLYNVVLSACAYSELPSSDSSYVTNQFHCRGCHLKSLLVRNSKAYAFDCHSLHCILGLIATLYPTLCTK